MNKYITDFKQIGSSILNVDLVCKDWNDNFSIATFINEDAEEYTFMRNNHSESQISKEQAFEIVNRLKLVHVKDNMFESAGNFHTESFIKSEIDRISKMKQRKEHELSIISKMICKYESSL